MTSHSKLSNYMETLRPINIKRARQLTHVIIHVSQFYLHCRSSGWSVGVPVRTCQTRLSSSANLAGASAPPLHPSGHRPLIVWDHYPSVLPHPPSLSRMAHPPFTLSHPHTVTSSQVGLPQAVIAVCHFHCSQEGQHTHTHTHTRATFISSPPPIDCSKCIINYVIILIHLFLDS